MGATTKNQYGGYVSDNIIGTRIGICLPLNQMSQIKQKRKARLRKLDANSNSNSNGVVGGTSNIGVTTGNNDQWTIFQSSSHDYEEYEYSPGGSNVGNVANIGGVGGTNSGESNKIQRRKGNWYNHNNGVEIGFGLIKLDGLDGLDGFDTVLWKSESMYLSAPASASFSDVILPVVSNVSTTTTKTTNKATNTNINTAGSKTKAKNRSSPHHSGGSSNGADNRGGVGGSSAGSEQYHYPEFTAFHNREVNSTTPLSVEMDASDEEWDKISMSAISKT
jgi:hypothetical protein